MCNKYRKEVQTISLFFIAIASGLTAANEQESGREVLVVNYVTYAGQ
jgi:hypothetical protein